MILVQDSYSKRIIKLFNDALTKTLLIEDEQIRITRMVHILVLVLRFREVNIMYNTVRHSIFRQSWVVTQDLYLVLLHSFWVWYKNVQINAHKMLIWKIRICLILNIIIYKNELDFSSGERTMPLSVLTYSEYSKLLCKNI